MRRFALIAALCSISLLVQGGELPVIEVGQTIEGVVLDTAQHSRLEQNVGHDPSQAVQYRLHVSDPGPYVLEVRSAFVDTALVLLGSDGRLLDQNQDGLWQTAPHARVVVDELPAGDYIVEVVAQRWDRGAFSLQITAGRTEAQTVAEQHRAARIFIEAARARTAKAHGVSSSQHRTVTGHWLALLVRQGESINAEFAEFRTTASSYDNAWVLGRVANAWHRLELFDTASSAFLEALTVLDTIQSPGPRELELREWLLFQRGHALKLGKQFVEAAASYADAAQIAQSLRGETDPRLAWHHRCVADTLRWGDIERERAESEYQQALAIYDRARSPRPVDARREGYTLKQLVNLLETQESRVALLDDFLGRAAKRERIDPSILFRAHALRSNPLWSLGRTVESTAANAASKAAYEQIVHPKTALRRDHAWSLGIYASRLARIGHPDDAIRQSRHALKTYDTLRVLIPSDYERMMSRIRQTVSWFEELDQHDQARAFLEERLDLALARFGSSHAHVGLLRNIVERVAHSKAARHASSDHRSRRTQIDWTAGHTSSSNVALFSPDGERILTTGRDRQALVWDATTGKLLASTPRHVFAAWAAAFDPASNGEFFVTGSNFGEIRIADTRTGGLVSATRSGHAKVYAVAINPEGTRIATGAADGAVQIWDRHDLRQPVATFSGHSQKLSAACFSPDGAVLATSSHDCTVRLWDAETGTQLHRLAAHEKAVTWVDFHPDGSRIVTASRDHTMRVWDVKTTPPELRFEVRHPQPLGRAVFHPQGTHIATTARDDVLRIWDAETGAPVRAIPLAHGPIRFVDYHPSGERLVVSGDSGPVRVLDAHTGEELLALSAAYQRNGHVGFSPDGQRIVILEPDRPPREIDVSTGQPVSPRGRAPGGHRSR